jgi:hypothetical protein
MPYLALTVRAVRGRKGTPPENQQIGTLRAVSREGSRKAGIKVLDRGTFLSRSQRKVQMEGSAGREKSEIGSHPISPPLPAAWSASARQT